MRLLVLGGTRFVGRAIVDQALERGDEVTAVSRGESGKPAPGVEWIQGDRSSPSTLEPLLAREWDAVIDTWAGEPDVVATSAERLTRVAGWYGFVSTRSVYRWPLPVGADESAPLVDPATAGDTGYAANKRGAELAVASYFEKRCVLARAGLIVGPHEDTARLTWWISRAAVGGSMVAPTPHDRPWQYVDARDLAGFMLGCATKRTVGAYNVVCPRDADVTTQRLLEVCVAVTGAGARLEWVGTETLRRAGIGEWDDLPGWTAPDGELAGMHDCDVGAAIGAGLTCRSIEQTVTDTWRWLREIPPSRRPPRRPGLPRRGLTAEQEQAVWWLSARKPNR